MSTKYFVEAKQEDIGWSTVGEWFNTKKEALEAFKDKLSRIDEEIYLKETLVNSLFEEYLNGNEDLDYLDVVEEETILYEAPSMPNYKGWWTFEPINLTNRGSMWCTIYAHYIHDTDDWFDCCVDSLIEGCRIEATYYGEEYLPDDYINICDEDLKKLSDFEKNLYYEENWLRYSLEVWKEKKRNEAGKFCVLSEGEGGWYCHGEAPTLLGAKRLATKSQYFEGFDWYTPIVMRMEDTREVKNFYGLHRAPKRCSECSYWVRDANGRWHEYIF